LSNVDVTKRQIVYELVHFRECGENSDSDEIKNLGIYSTEQQAEEAIERYFLLPGFNKYPRSCFIIGECELDKDKAWTDGFTSSDEIADEFMRIVHCFNEWLGMSKPVEEALKNTDYYNAICQVDEQVYKLKNPGELACHINKVWQEVFPETRKSSTEYLDVAKKILLALKGI
jgi:hypothetical protein